MNFGIILVSILIIYVVATIIELVGLYRFNLRFFDNGFKIYKREISHQFSNWSNLDGIYSEKEGNYVFLPEYKIGYFVSRLRFYRNYSIFAYSRGLPLIIFGRFTDSDNKLEITYFISYRLVFLITIWLLIWTVLPISTGKLLTIVLGVAGVSFTLLILYFIYIFQQGKMLIMSDEIEKILKIKK
jgi:hypothetical protein